MILMITIVTNRLYIDKQIFVALDDWTTGFEGWNFAYQILFPMRLSMGLSSNR